MSLWKRSRAHAGPVLFYSVLQMEFVAYMVVRDMHLRGFNCASPPPDVVE